MLTKEEFVKTHPDVRMGMTAYSLDGEKLGVVERIDEDSLTIERGWFFHKDFAIPYDDIEDIREDQVIVRQRRDDIERERTEASRLEEAGRMEESEFTGRTGGIGEYERGREVEVTKRPAGKEEVRVRKEARTETEPVRGEVRKEEVKVEPNKPAQKK